MLSITCGEIREKVRRLTIKYKTTDPFELCGCLGVVLNGVNFGESETSIKAMTIVISKICCIQYNVCLSDVLLRFILAHELGHAVLHKRKQHIDTGFFDGVSQTEKEANLFAAELLFGESKNLYDKMQNRESTLFEFAAECKVPYELLAYKLEIMKDEGYEVPSIPYEPDSRFLGGNLGLDNCYKFYG